MAKHCHLKYSQWKKLYLLTFIKSWWHQQRKKKDLSSLLLLEIKKEIIYSYVTPIEQKSAKPQLLVS